MFKPVLVWYIGECTVSMINISNGIKDPTYGYKKCTTSQYWYLVGKVREPLYTQVIIWVNTILDHIDTTVILPMKVLAWYVKLKCTKNTHTVNYP